MPVKSVPTRFETSDGRKFDNKEVAERWQEVLEAKERFSDALVMFSRELAESIQTADGVPFDFAAFSDYYYVGGAAAGMPWLGAVHYYGWNVKLTNYEDAVAIHSDSTTDRVEIPISRLYRHREKAQAAVFAAQRGYLERQLEKVAEDERRLQG